MNRAGHDGQCRTRLHIVALGKWFHVPGQVIIDKARHDGISQHHVPTEQILFHGGSIARLGLSMNSYFFDDDEDDDDQRDFSNHVFFFGTA